MVLLGVNIDHVATLRNARGGDEPQTLQAALLAECYGADGITVHLREDRRHIRDKDLRLLKNGIKSRLNLEMAAVDEMLEIALSVQPAMVTLVPERREELTTEGGLNVVCLVDTLTPFVQRLNQANIAVSLFIDPVAEQVEASKRVGAGWVELHTGGYAETWAKDPKAALVPLKALMDAADLAGELGLKVNAGHGLNYDNIKPILALPDLVEVNIGHSIIARAVFIGLGPAVDLMKQLVSQTEPSVELH